MWALVSCCAGLAPPSPPPTPLHWLPLGDSITYGCGSLAAPRAGVKCPALAGGYRVPLAFSLEQQGHNVSTMGTLTTGPPNVPAEWLRHEGHPGWRFDQIDAILDKSLASSGTPPNLVTIHLGTNDCGQSDPLPVITARMQSLLAHLHTAAPDANVFLASMIGFPGEPVCSTTFNAQLPDVVAAWRAKGMRIYYVPMAEWSGVCVANITSALGGLCCSGRVHPTSSGYLRMASAFALAIAESGAFA